MPQKVAFRHAVCRVSRAVRSSGAWTYVDRNIKNETGTPPKRPLVGRNTPINSLSTDDKQNAGK